jgi:hypothetical protein
MGNGVNGFTLDPTVSLLILLVLLLPRHVQQGLLESHFLHCSIAQL